MNNFRCVARYTFKRNILWLLIGLKHRDLIIKNRHFLFVFEFDLDRESCFTEFALEVLPKVS